MQRPLLDLSKGDGFGSGLTASIAGQIRGYYLDCEGAPPCFLPSERELAQRGYRRASDSEVPDLWVVNTCAVTSEGMKKSRKAVRRCAGSGARGIVTGCGADLDPGAVDADGVERVLPNRDKPALVSDACPGACERVDTVPWTPEEIARVPLKVQEGCARFCTYCVVPHLRPGPYSKPAATVTAEAAEIAAGGAGEIILCGIDLGSYSDPDSGEGLGTLAVRVSEAAPGTWVRLSSIELSDVTGDLLASMRAGSVCRHLHLPLQSGDAGVLRGMGRSYDPLAFAARVEEIKTLVPGMAVTSDVMVGFPGEDEAAFENTLEMVERLRFSRLHVFKYSPRPMTAASELGDPVPAESKAARALLLRRAGERAAAEFHTGLAGRIIEVLVEDTMDSEPGMLFGRTESFAGAVFAGPPESIGNVVELEVTSGEASFVRGRLVRQAGREDELVGG